MAEAWLRGVDGSAALAAARALEARALDAEQTGEQTRRRAEEPRASTAHSTAGGAGGAGGAAHARPAGGGDGARGAAREAPSACGASTARGALASGGARGSSLAPAGARKAQREGPSNESEVKGARWMTGRRKGAAAADWTI